MTDHKPFKDESQDARRRDQHDKVHPGKETTKHHEKVNSHKLSKSPPSTKK